jgi:two-component system sensor histidine kinase KdpD
MKSAMNRRMLIGVLVALAGIAGASAVMLAVRGHLSLATPALVLVLPVMAGAAIGGFGTGVIAVVAGFLAYDLFFIPPYYRLSVGAAQNWVALVVYAVVMLVVSRMVAYLQAARADARQRESQTRRLSAVTDQLTGDKSVDELLGLIVTTVHEEFAPRWVTVLLPAGDSLEVSSSAGAALSEDERRALVPAPGRLESLGTAGSAGITKVVLTALGRPVGLLAMSGAPLDRHQWELLRTYANQAASALERSRLRGQALRTELLEEVDRWRDALMSAVSHDLRTPLASVKTAVSTLRRSGVTLSPDDQQELLELIETQSDNLARLVTNLLDMTRIQSGALELRREVGPVSDVVEAALRAIDRGGSADAVIVLLPDDLPLVDIDQLLMVQVLANLLENAVRHSPGGQPVEVMATVAEGTVEVSVQDHGSGIAPAERERVFQMFNRPSGSGRAGLGLTIAKSFVEAHGESIRVEEAPGGGARFVFTMPRATVPADAA